MAGCLYFVPERGRGLKAAELAALGLGHAFERGRFTPREVLNGPGGCNGVVLADDRHVDPARLGYYADEQEWRRIPGSEAWVGIYRAEPPVPAELVRERLVDGHPVTLGDGHEYLIPAARKVSEAGTYPALPSASTIDADGHWQLGEVVPAYRPLWAAACRYWDAFMGARDEGRGAGGEGRIAMDFDGLHDAALLALAANYRVGKAEVALLGLFNTECVHEVLKAVIDWPGLQELLKKKLPAAGG